MNLPLQLPSDAEEYARVPKAGGALQAVADTVVGGWILGADADSVFTFVPFNLGGTVGPMYEQPKAGGAAQMLVEQFYEPDAFVIDDSAFYLIDLFDAEPEPQLEVVPRNGDPATRPLPSDLQIINMVRDNDTLYMQAGVFVGGFGASRA